MADRTGWPVVLLAVAALGGVAAAWASLFSAPDIALQLETVGAGLSPRQAELEEAVAQARLQAPATTEVLVLSVDVEDAAFAAYLLYPARVSETSVRQRSAVRAALAALPAGALVLASRHGDRERLEDLEPLSRGPAPRLESLARVGDDVFLYRVLP